MAKLNEFKYELQAIHTAFTRFGFQRLLLLQKFQIIFGVERLSSNGEVNSVVEQYSAELSVNHYRIIEMIVLKLRKIILNGKTNFFQMFTFFQYFSSSNWTIELFAASILEILCFQFTLQINDCTLSILYNATLELIASKTLSENARNIKFSSTSS